MTTATITPDTTLYDLTQDVGDYTLEDHILGDMSAAEYARKFDAQALTDLCSWLEEMAEPRNSAFFLSEETAQAARDEREDGWRWTITRFTPREIHERLMVQGRREMAE